MDEDLLSTLAALPNQPYSPQDRYQDFRQLFTGTEQGKRVYREILAWAHTFRSSLPTPVDPYLLAFKEGERNMGLKLMAAVNIEPKEKPKQQKR